MKRFGIREVSFLIQYKVKKDHVDFKIMSVRYFSDYDGDAEIKKYKDTRAIYKSGLEGRLKAAILAKVQTSEFAKFRKGDGITSPDEFGATLFDDEALPAGFTIF